MEHIRQFDWCKFVYDPHPEHFLEEEDLDNSVTERILRGTFRNPFLSDDDSDDQPISMDWDKFFHKKWKKNTRSYIPGLKPVSKYLKLSALTFRQQFSILKILCAKYPQVLETYTFNKPESSDKKVLREFKEIYEAEQKEFLQWAKTVWMTGDNVKALKTMPIIENVYQSLFQIQQLKVSALQKNYEMAAHIELKHTNKSACSFTLKKDLVPVKKSELPELIVPSMSEKFSLYENNPHLPKSCKKHPTNIILPNENKVTHLAINEVYEEFLHYAASHNVPCIMSEVAATKLIEEDRNWTLPLFVRAHLCADGQKRNIIVIGDEIIYNKETCRYRTYNAMQHLVNAQFVKKPLKDEILIKPNLKTYTKPKRNQPKQEIKVPETKDEISDEDDILVIDDGISLQKTESPEEKEEINNDSIETEIPCKKPRLEENSLKFIADQKSPTKSNKGETLVCTCKDSTAPPIRSFRKWRLKNPDTIIQDIDIIIHCEHKCQVNGQEYILETIPEYQLELAGSVQSDHKLRSLALSLHLRNNATLLNVRVDSYTGDLVTIDYLSLPDLDPNGEYIQDSAYMFHNIITQLNGLKAGDYLLTHEERHGSNVMLQVARRHFVENGLHIKTNTEVTDEAEMADLATPPNLGPVLLPFHKHRKLIPLAFSYDQKNIAKVKVKPQKPPKPKKKGKRGRKPKKTTNKI